MSACYSHLSLFLLIAAAQRGLGIPSHTLLLAISLLHSPTALPAAQTPRPPMKLILALTALVLAVLSGASAMPFDYQQELRAAELYKNNNQTMLLSMSKCTEKQQEYGIHGLWPQWGMECGGAAYSPSAVAGFRKEMETEWFSCKGAGNNDAFWKHEWDKHGSCTGMGVTEYFRTTLDLAAKFRHICKPTIDIQIAPGNVVAVPNKECRICITKSLTLC